MTPEEAARQAMAHSPDDDPPRVRLSAWDRVLILALGSASALGMWWLGRLLWNWAAWAIAGDVA